MEGKNYKKELQKYYEEWLEDNRKSMSKLEFIGEFVFDFTTYDSGEGSALKILTKNMLEVIRVILKKETFEYINEDTAYLNYMTMVNMPFLEKKLEWGGSIRGAWFDCYHDKIEIDCGRIVVAENDIENFIEQLLSWEKTREENTK